ncbi:MAG: stress response translation initiation inhibitor YciH [Thermodesulfobacteriota bacterium]
MSKGNTRLVYSDDPADRCDTCGKLTSTCRCAPGPKQDPTRAVVRIGREAKGRKGSGVTVVSGIPLPEKELKQLAKQLKKKCGCGGTLKDGVIEIQGDQRDFLLDLLQQQGWTVKKAGG